MSSKRRRKEDDPPGRSERSVQSEDDLAPPGSSEILVQGEDDDKSPPVFFVKPVGKPDFRVPPDRVLPLPEASAHTRSLVGEFVTLLLAPGVQPAPRQFKLGTGWSGQLAKIDESHKEPLVEFMAQLIDNGTSLGIERAALPC